MTLVTLRQYFAAAGSRYSADDAKVIGPELERLAGDARPGQLPPGAIVRAATDPGSPLHRYFDWDDELAGRKWRLAQANDMKAKILVVPVGGEPKRVEPPGSRAIEVRPASPRVPAPSRPSREVAQAYRSPLHPSMPSLVRETPPKPSGRAEELPLMQAALKPLLEWDKTYQPLAAEYPAFKKLFESVFEAIERCDVMIEAAS